LALDPQSVSIIGCGYAGLHLARRWLAVGARVRGFATRPESLQRIAASGAQALPLDLDTAIAAHDFSGELVYYSVPPAPREEGDARLNRFLTAAAGIPKRLVYLSTTGVYGDHAGSRVDEDTPPDPLTKRAARRLAAETLVRAWADARSVSWCILRVAGIYGSGRLPLDRLRRGVPAVIPGEAAPGNRIHVTDLVSACLAAGIVAAADRRIYNVADGNHASATEFLQRVAAIVGLPPPPLVSRAQAMKELPEAARSFLAESRLIDNRRMIAELGVSLNFADLDAGIEASLLED
jgi:nucleoside-diphosphate-sugar epimerase